MSQQKSQSMFTSFSNTVIDLLGTVNTAANLVNRTVNSIDQYAQTVERHAIDYNHKSLLVSQKRREQLEEQYKLLTPEQKEMLNKSSPFDNITA